MPTIPQEDRRRTSARLVTLQVGVIICFAALGICFWVLQVVHHEKYLEMADSNYQRTLALRAPRGVMFDRNGRVLVENRNSYTISINRESTSDLARSVDTIARILKLDRDEVQEIVDRHRQEPRYRPIPIVHDASLEQVAAVMARQYELPEVRIEQVPTRKYPENALAAHLFGYVGEANEEQVKEAGLTRGTIVGQHGVEKVYNALLMGEDGAETVIVNSVGREIRTVEEAYQPPVEGRRVQLTIDYDLQKATEDGFRAAGFNGAALIMDPRTGEVLVHASLPAYDPNDFAGGIDSRTYRSLIENPLRPLTNRVLQGRYSPGSTFKIVVAAAAMEEGVATPDTKIYCGGGATFFGRYTRCHLRGGHGLIDMRHAIEKSCNVYFYTIGNMLGVDRIYKWAEKLGLTGRTGIDLPNETASLVPNTEWKRRTTGEPWYPGETISVAIGQGQVNVTPASLAVMIATVANNGRRVIPRVVKAVDEGNGWVPVAPPPATDTTTFKPDTFRALVEGLWMVVNASGTGGRARIPGRDVAGKTGTAQVISNEGRARARNSGRDLRDHGWFVFFAPRDNPEIAGVIFGEHNEHGYLGAPIAKHVIETYFAKKEGKPLPVLPSKAPALPPVPDPDSPPALPPVAVADARPVNATAIAQ